MATNRRFSLPFNSRTRAFFGILLAIMVVALLVRVTVAVGLYSARSVRDPLSVTDMATYRRLASDIVSGRFPAFYYYQPFYYAVFLPLVYLVFGVRAFGVVAVQLVLSTVTVYLTAVSAARLFGRRAGLIAGLLLALAAFPVFYVPFHLIATLQAFLLALLLAVSIACWRRDRLLLWLCGGAVLSASILTRGNALLLVPGFLALAVWRRRRSPRRAVALAAFLVLAVVIPQLPFALVNAAHYGRWTGPSSAQDAVLALGNTPEAPPGGLEYPASYHAWVHKAQRTGGERVPVSREILEWALESPLAFLELKLRALLLFWHRMEIPNNISIDREGRQSVLLRLPLLLPFAVTGSLGLFGLFTLWKSRSPLRLLLYYMVGMYWLATALFYILARFRVPLVPVLCVVAGGGIGRLPVVWRSGLAAEQKRQRLLLRGLAAALAAFCVLDGFTAYQRHAEAAAMRCVRPRGVSVTTDERVIVYDRGPLGIGGVRFFDLPPAGLTMEKTFPPPTDVPQWLGDANVIFRVPAQLTPTARINIDLTHAGNRYGAEALSVVTEQGIQWLEVGLGPVSLADARKPFRLTIAVPRGKCSLGFDTLRDYGRTTVRDAGGAILELDAECAAELVWKRVVQGG